MDKEEITRDAQRHRHVRDVDHSGRGLLHAVHAAISRDARVAGEVEAAEAGLDVAALVEHAVADAVVEDFRFPVLKLPVVRQQTAQEKTQ